MGKFNTPFSISIKGDVMYVADFGNHHIQKLTVPTEVWPK